MTTSRQVRRQEARIDVKISRYQITRFKARELVRVGPLTTGKTYPYASAKRGRQAAR